MNSCVSVKLLEAINVASRAHDGHYRKATDIPYICHPFAVMHIASKQGLPEDIEQDVLIACLLHDVLEDVPKRYGARQIERDFGPKVLELVHAVTKDKSLAGWQDRANAYLDTLRKADLGAVVISACDKLHNLNSILADYEQVGPVVWERFNSSKQQQQWWYESIFDIVCQRAAHLPLVPQYREQLGRLKAL